MNRTGNNTTGWARRLTALLITACLVMAMALPVYAEVNPLPGAPEVELLEDEPGTAPGEDTALPEQNAATPVPDAATPEPEQSAGPEQPAPTETPEPTAEPTPTPEPTATPVPTVTPTATPEPTEQPQKMYAARSVGNVQAVSEGGVPDTYTLYFAVPKSWIDYTGVTIRAIIGKSKNDPKYELPMKEVSETDDERKIYSVVLNNAEHYPHGVLGGLEFRGYKGETHTYTVTIVKVDDNDQLRDISFDPVNSNYIGGDYYDGKNEDGWHPELWKKYTVGHKHFANKPMAFENKTSETLTNVQAWFYEPNKEDTGKLEPVGTPIPLNSTESGSGIASNSTAKFNIPSVLCSYVQFTWDEGGSQKSSKIYNFYGKDVSGDDEKSFTYSDTSNCFIYTGAGNERWGIENSVLIYYDATFSKLPTTGTGNTSGDYSIPTKADQSTVYYRLNGDNKESIGGTMSRIKDTDCYAADVPEGYTKIVFSSRQLSSDDITTTCGDTTDWVNIPSDYKETEQCFYADTNDDAVYNKGTRGGYWAPKGTKRDAETWKNKNTDTKVEVVDIAPAEFTEDPNTKYVTSTLYDYYTDYELNGNNRDNYKYDGYQAASHRNWVTFREFDQALSDYYEKAGAQYPIYTGHFQPAGTAEFSQIAETLNLFGYNKNFNRFMAINNALRNDDNSGNFEHTYYAYQGLVADKTSTGNADGAPLLYGTTSTVEPHFNKDFLLGENSKKAKLGEVYENVKFPFTKATNPFGNEEGVDYWYFDSSKTTLYLKQDSGHNSDSKYFLQESTDNEQKERSLNVNVSSSSQGEHGYFPFNETATGGVASTYNYGFGTKLQMDFTLTDDGKVETTVNGKKERTSIKFFFSGDDDVWVFIDGKLALDVGGAHGKVSGLLEFGETKTDEGEEKNSVTAYVSQVKKGGTANDEDKGENTGKSHVKTVTYNNKEIKFYAQNTNLEPLDKNKKHTLTMYYMERGMWGSNMAVAFNFPDNNELQVQKEVDLSNVTDDDFKDCFKKQKIFNFTIQNQATHYGEKEAVGSDKDDTKYQKVNLTAKGNTIEPATPRNEAYIFELADNPGPDSKTNTEKVLHWYARYQDTEPVSKYRYKRYGILKLEDPINIKDMRFLTFEVYVDPDPDGGGGDLSLNNLYLELLDNQDTPGQKGSLGTTGINGATYGSVKVTTGQWVTVKLDLNKMKEQGGTDGSFNDNVQTIRVGDNYSRHIYFRNFTFIPKAKPLTMSGFTTKQEDIPDYKSAESGKLQNAENAQYTSNMDNDTQLVEGDGSFVLEDGEIVTFSDQFRRGSYISLKEELNKNLYDTTWTVYENGEAVTSTNPTNPDNVSHVILGTPRPLNSQNSPAEGPDDGRMEAYDNDENVKNEGYKENAKPGTNTIVFRSYKNPDEKSSTLTKLKVKYVNTVKTGGLKIQKQAADGENLTGTYKFKVTFNNVGGEGLEKEPIIKYVEINMSDESNKDHTGTITGIPVGTRYTIEEVENENNDGARLQSVTVPAECTSAHVISNNTMVEGVIKVANTTPVTAIFTNTRRTLINIAFDKLWIDANGKDNLGTANQPDKINIQLQRRLASEKDWAPVIYPAGSTKNYVTITCGEKGWTSTFSGLDQYPIGGSADNNYIYRIVEGTVEAGKFTEVKPNETITIKGNTYVVTAKAEAKISDGDNTKVTQATATDGTITGDSGTIVLTNKLQNPKFVLDIIKKDAEKGENNSDVPLSDVEFKLEKLKAETTAEGKTQYTVVTDYKFSSSGENYLTGTTGQDGRIIKNPFTNLEPGRYRLTETKAHPGYNLLSKSIDIEFTQDGKYKIDDGTAQNATGDAASGYTVTLPVLNRKTPELPHTGADAPSLWLLIGLPLAVAGLLIFTFRYNRKGGRRH